MLVAMRARRRIAEAAQPLVHGDEGADVGREPGDGGVRLAKAQDWARRDRGGEIIRIAVSPSGCVEALIGANGASPCRNSRFASLQPARYGRPRDAERRARGAARARRIRAASAGENRGRGSDRTRCRPRAGRAAAPRLPSPATRRWAIAPSMASSQPRLASSTGPRSR